MSKVSIIIPTFNSALTLSDALDSVINQRYRDFEIIVVDDGSIDNTRKIVEGYIKKRQSTIRYFYQENQGAGAARNKGIYEARGGYISFLDADDILLSHSLLIRAKFLETYPTVDLVFTDYFIKDKPNSFADNSPVLRTKQFLERFKPALVQDAGNSFTFNKSFYNRYLSFSPLPIWINTIMIRKEALKEKNLFRTDLSVGEDTEFWLRLIKSNSAGYIDSPTAIYNTFTNNSLTKNLEKYYLDTLKVFFAIYNNNDDSRVVIKLAKKKISDLYFNLGYYYFESNNLNYAREYFFKGFSFNRLRFSLLLYFAVSMLPLSINKFLRSTKIALNLKTKELKVIL